MALVFLEQREKNLPDSLADNNYQSFGSGSGDRRFNVPGNWETDPHVYDFYLEDVEFYFFTRNDLLDYIHSIQEEICYPTQNYTKFPNGNLKAFYDNKIVEISKMPEVTTLHFVKSSRSGGTSYIANDNVIDGEIYNRFREICLSSSKQGSQNAYTTYRFVKYKDTSTGKCYMNLIPIFSKKYNMRELAEILKRDFDVTSDWHTFVYIFGMQYAENIISQKISCNKLVELAKIHDEQVAKELQQAVNLFQYIKDNKISINPIDNKLNILGAYLQNTSTNDTVQLLSNIETSSIYRQYITAIKTKPFLLLAGISGTGKSRIVRELARACWQPGSDEFKAQKPSNFEMVQVKPNWHDSSELIGYVSRIDGERFIAGDFLKFIAKAWENEGVPYFLCLDEMNLAPVEQYFAEYLSVIESRKSNGNKVITDPILNPVFEKAGNEKNIKTWYKNLIKELLADCSDEKVFALTKQFETEGITIPQNLIVIGTVNMDETTFSFSRKVLDRAMTIEMNEVDFESGLHDKNEKIGHLGCKDLIGAFADAADVYEDNKAVCDIVIAYLKEINKKLEGTPFKVAYRTRNEFMYYVVNNLPYNKDYDGNDISQDRVIARALDEITNMKVLSRIEGDEAKVSAEFLKELETTIREGLEDVCAGIFDEDLDEPYPSVSLAKLKEMKERLKSGYTSFWS